MYFDKLSEEWQDSKMPINLDQSTYQKMMSFEGQLQKENTKLTYWLAGTIYLTACITLPFLDSEKLMLTLGGIWFLLGVQAVLFWFRQMHIAQAIEDKPLRFIDAKLAKLQYNLLVTNLFMPLYMLLLATLSSYYMYHVLSGVELKVVVTVIALTLLFYILVFVLSWRRQRKKDKELILPQMLALQELKAQY